MSGAFKVGITAEGTARIIETLAALGRISLAKADKIIEVEANRAVRSIQSKWPVKTGFSRAQWRAVKLGPGRWQLVNDADYASYVHRKGNPSVLVGTLVPAELRQMSSRISDKLAKAIATKSTTLAPGRFSAMGVST